MRHLASPLPANRSRHRALARFGPARLRRVQAVVTAAIVLAGLAFAVGAPGAAAVPPRPRLLVIGDSIILGTGGNIAADLPDWDVTFDAAVSRSTEAGLAALQTHGTDYQFVVIALGANDGGTPGVFAPRVADLLGALATVPHVLWLTIHEARPYYAQTNAIIRSEVAHHPNAAVGDWNAAIKPGDVGEDGLHLTPQGSTDMASWVAGIVRTGTPTTTTTTTTTTSTTSTTSTTTSTTVAPPTTPAATARRAPRSARTDPPTGGGGATGWWVAVVGLGLLAVATVTGLVVTARRSAAARDAAVDDPTQPRS
jgi:hypothetical protein